MGSSGDKCVQFGRGFQQAALQSTALDIKVFILQMQQASVGRAHTLLEHQRQMDQQQGE